MKKTKVWFLFWAAGLVVLIAGCADDTTGPQKLLDKFFSSALQQDYGTTYTCYYQAYQAKVSREEFIKHRKEASVLLAYKILSIKMVTDEAAEAEVRLTFGPSARLNRKEPVTVSVKEALIREGGEWKIKVW